jgi:alpha-tubulin suppressor-like RCC1 family protein
VRVDTELRFDTIASGVAHACGLADGQAYCWGNNGAGELGTGDFLLRPNPTPVTGGHTFVSLFVGGYHNCGLLASGEALCWGSNVHGGLGDSTLVDRAEPGPIEGGLRFSSIAAGPYHSCGITTEGELWCWGLNDTQQLGTTAGDTVCESILGPHTCSLAPVRVETGELVPVSVYAGGAHTCALDANGAAWCWGQNDLGQLGTGTASQGGIIAPQEVAGGHAFESLTTTMMFTCGLTVGGDAYCWGLNDKGQIGTELSQTCFTSWFTAEPCVPAPSALSGGVDFDFIDSGTYYGCGYATTGTPYCWGNNESGQLGAGANASVISTEPLPVFGAT